MPLKLNKYTQHLRGKISLPLLNRGSLKLYLVFIVFLNEHDKKLKHKLK